MAKPNNPDPARPCGLRGVKLRLPDGRRTAEDRIWNTSLGGVFIATDPPLPFGTEIGLEFMFSREAQNIRCAGFIVWSTLDSPEKAPAMPGMCVRLVNIEVSEMRRLATAVGQDLEG